MATYSSEPDFQTEPKQRFYPTQGMQNQPRIPSAPTPFSRTQTDSLSLRPFPTVLPSSVSEQPPRSGRKNDDANYLMHRHPILLQRLYNAADILLTSYRPHDFIYDTYPDYLSLHLMRDRLLRENNALTEEFLQSGCPLSWLNLLTDTVISELLCRKRCSQRRPIGDARTTSVQSASRS